MILQDELQTGLKLSLLQRLWFFFISARGSVKSIPTQNKLSGSNR